MFLRRFVLLFYFENKSEFIYRFTRDFSLMRYSLRLSHACRSRIFCSQYCFYFFLNELVENNLVIFFIFPNIHFIMSTWLFKELLPFKICYKTYHLSFANKMHTCTTFFTRIPSLTFCRYYQVRCALQ